MFIIHKVLLFSNFIQLPGTDMDWIQYLEKPKTWKAKKYNYPSKKCKS